MKMINDARQRQDFSKFESVNVLKQIDDDYFLKIVESYYRFAQLLVKADGKVSQKEEEMLKRIWHLLHLDDSSENTSEKLPYEAFKVTSLALEEQTTLEDLLKELHSLVGMVNIKQDVQTLTNLLHVQKARTSQGLPSTTVNLHSVFYGPPGTGKTTIARLIGKIFKQMGFLKKGHLVETDRAGLVAGYVGQTSLKVDEVVKSALDGVLFIDEAYALIPDNSPSDYGLEAINILLKRMEDYRDRLIVIIAGYTDEMLKLMQSNPGIKSRFNRYFYFENFSPNELTQIFEIFCNKTNLFLTDGAKNKLKAIFNILHANKDKSFGNARLARNLFEKTIERQANRIAGIAPLTEEILSSITEEDIPPESQCTGYK
ncbi:MAG: AAA family ATPase [Sedimentibacter sp.]|nr:AAA family ATPase [Sedimentibacter sp.]